MTPRRSPLNPLVLGRGPPTVRVRLPMSAHTLERFTSFSKPSEVDVSTEFEFLLNRFSGFDYFRPTIKKKIRGLTPVNNDYSTPVL